MTETDNLKKFYSEGKLAEHVFLWGIGKKTKSLIEGIRSKIPNLEIEGIIDNFKSDFLAEYESVPVFPALKLEEYDEKDVSVLLAVATSQSIWKMLDALGIKNVHNLTNPDDRYEPKRCDYPYTFIDRKKDKDALVYVLAGYQKELWDTSLARMFEFMEPEFDYCMISSGKHDEQLQEFCEKYGWSYIYSDHNQICYLQNLVIGLHPKAQMFIKLDEDMFIGRGFYSRLLNGYRKAEETGEYRVGCVVPVMPLNYNSYISYLDAIGKRSEFEERFGRSYRCVFSAPYSTQEAAVWIWETLDSVDAMSDYFAKRDAAPKPLCSLYNIGAILYSRKRWIMFGKWPEDPEHSGMGVDEGYLFRENMGAGMATYEIQNVFAAHFAFSEQKNMMFDYYRNNHHKFEMH